MNPYKLWSDKDLKKATKLANEIIKKGGATQFTFEVFNACTEELKRRGYKLVVAPA